jgi:hypothetical protein
MFWSKVLDFIIAALIIGLLVVIGAMLDSPV